MIVDFKQQAYKHLSKVGFNGLFINCPPLITLVVTK
jgi:hypothetical protein